MWYESGVLDKKKNFKLQKKNNQQTDNFLNW